MSFLDGDGSNEIPTWDDVVKLARHDPVVNAVLMVMRRNGRLTREQALIVLVIHMSKNIETLESQLKYQLSISTARYIP